MKRVLKYLNGTKHMKLTISIDNLNVLKWWVDASYNAHEDCKGHTGVMMSMGHGAMVSFSRKQKLNTRSSTEAELVGIDDALPMILWCKYFLEDLGYTIEHNIVFQDNKSTILLATNGRWSSSKRTKHIKARYFLVKDKIEQGDMEVQHESTHKMWSDVLNKPKQGKAFREFRGHLMNVPEDYDDEAEHLNTHPSLLPPADEGEKVLEADSEVLTKAAGATDGKSMTSGTKPAGHRRSVLGELQNNSGQPTKGGKASWADMVRRGAVRDAPKGTCVQGVRTNVASATSHGALRAAQVGKMRS